MTKARPLPSLEIVESYLDYNPETGIGTWKRKRIGRGAQITVGLPAGTVSNNGYIYIQLFGQRCAAHRLFWLLYYKKDPGDEIIDHIDQNKLNNKIANLRLATRSQNRLNVSPQTNNNTGIVGVHYCNTRQDFIARIKINNQPIHLGRFKNIEDAIAARRKAEIMYL
jgi:hypothetical protein